MDSCDCKCSNCRILTKKDDNFTRCTSIVLFTRFAVDSNISHDSICCVKSKYSEKGFPRITRSIVFVKGVWTRTSQVIKFCLSPSDETRPDAGQIETAIRHQRRWRQNSHTSSFSNAFRRRVWSELTNTIIRHFLLRYAIHNVHNN